MQLLSFFQYLFLGSVLLQQINARELYAKALVPCDNTNSISAKTFKVTFNPLTKQLNYNLDLDTSINGYINATIDVYAYGFKIISKTIDLCSMSFKQFCPLYSGEVIVDSTETIDASYVKEIPGVAYTVPDIDGYVRVNIQYANGTNAGCMAAYFENGKTVAHTGVKWATAVIAGLGLIVAAILSTFGNSNAASHISVNALSLFTYFQSVVLISMTHVQSVPPIASAWATNLSWSMGLIRVEFMQKIFRWYIQSTGGSPTLYLNKYFAKAVLIQKRFYDVLETGRPLFKRAAALVVNSSTNLIVLRGIDRIGYYSNIEPTSIVVTGFTFFVLFGYLLVIVLFCAKFLIQFLIKFGILKNSSAHYFAQQSYFHIIKGALLRYISIGFIQITVFSLWEFTRNDSPAVIVLSILFLILAVGLIAWTIWNVWRVGHHSVATYKNPAALLYGDQHVLDKYGFAYTMFNANFYWFTLVFFGYNFIKAVFIGLCQSSGKTQVLVIWILDMIYMGLLIHFQPFLDKQTNILNILIATVVTLNSFFFVFFSNLFQQPSAVSSIMGWIFFVLNAAFSLILLLIIIVYIVMAVVSKVPDARFRKANDDRTSFQRNSAVLLDEKSMDGALGSIPISNQNGSLSSLNRNSYTLAGNGDNAAGELFDLGNVARDHQANWENEIYKLKDMVNSNPELLDDPELRHRSKNAIENLKNHNKVMSPTMDGYELADEKNTDTVLTSKDSTLGALTRKLSAIKMSRSNSHRLKKSGSKNNNTASSGGRMFSTSSVTPLNADIDDNGDYNPTVQSPDFANNAFFAPFSNSNNNNHQRSSSQVPMNSANNAHPGTHEFNFVRESMDEQDRSGMGSENEPVYGADILGGHHGIDQSPRQNRNRYD